MSIRQHLVDVLKINPTPSPYPRMIVCIFSSTMPLVIGYATGTMSYAIFGSLTGFLLVLNDHMGALGHRLLTLTLTWLCMVGGLSLGILTLGHLPLQILTFSVMVYFLGLMGGGKGAELERAAVFGCLQFLAGAYSPYINSAHWLTVAYSFSAYASVVVFLSFVVFLRRFKINPNPSLRKTFKSAIYSGKERHIYAFFYVLTTCASIYAVKIFKIDHGYWAIGTMLLIMRPELQNSIYRAIQRLLGTVLGVIVASVLIKYIDHPLHVLPIAALLGFVGPLSFVSSYWLGSFVAVTMILLLMDIPFIGIPHEYDLAFIRFNSTALGCAMALLGVVVSQAITKSYFKIISFLKGRST